jgi:hypothetical protein
LKEGSQYKGQFKLNLYHGAGTYTREKDHYSYKGFWSRGVREGLGEEIIGTTKYVG